MVMPGTYFCLSQTKIVAIYLSAKTSKLSLVLFLINQNNVTAFLQGASSTGTDRSTYGWRIAMMQDPECYIPEQSQSRSETAVSIQVFSGKVFTILLRAMETLA